MWLSSFEIPLRRTGAMLKRAMGRHQGRGGVGRAGQEAMEVTLAVH